MIKFENTKIFGLNTTVDRIQNVKNNWNKDMEKITITVDITAPLYWWKEFDAVNTKWIINPYDILHEVPDKEFGLDDFSHEHLIDDVFTFQVIPTVLMNGIIKCLNENRVKYIQSKDKKYWWQMLQILPVSYNQLRTVTISYEALAHIYKSLKSYNLDEWLVGFTEWINSLPYSEFITHCG